VEGGCRSLLTWLISLSWKLADDKRLSNGTVKSENGKYSKGTAVENAGNDDEAFH